MPSSSNEIYEVQTPAKGRKADGGWYGRCFCVVRTCPVHEVSALEIAMLSCHTLHSNRIHAYAQRHTCTENDDRKQSKPVTEQTRAGLGRTYRNFRMVRSVCLLLESHGILKEWNHKLIPLRQHGHNAHVVC
mmetsp:Transcript_10590/g.29206  ORF Transcript_10590/g.29206 Transcript_10590/m.29206 type:complete len:132 (+) Transcript_10590:1967-2362(+)